MKLRDDRWPGSWEVEMLVPQGDFIVRVVNVSHTGLRFVGDLPAAPGDPALFVVMGRKVRGRLVRRTGTGGAIRFVEPIDDAQLASLRQYRTLPRAVAPAETEPLRQVRG